MFGPWFLPTLLFVLLSPGVLVTLPPKGKAMVVLAVHAALFAVLLTVLKQYRVFEGFSDPTMTGMLSALPSVGCVNGKKPDGTPC